MSDVVLFFPRSDPSTEWTELPLSVLYPAAFLTASGFKVEIIDSRMTRDWTRDIERAAKGDLIFFGVSSMTGHQISEGLAASRQFRALRPKVPIVWGGIHPSLRPEETLKNDVIDIVVRGEGEMPAQELARAIADGRRMWHVPGISYMEDGEVVHNPRPEPFDLDSMPPIPYELVSPEEYQKSSVWQSTSERIAYLTSKGCPFRCAYCYNERFYRRRWRGKSPYRVIEELKEMGSQWDPLELFLLDDNFFADLRRVEGILRGIIHSGLRPKIYNVNCRVDTILAMDSDLLEQLKAAGIQQLFVGAESGSDRVLESIGKGYSSDMILEANRKLRRASIETVYAFIAGFPGDTISDVHETLRLMVNLLKENPSAIVSEVSFYSPFPGTELMERCRRLGVDIPSRLEDWAHESYDQLVEDLFSAEEINYFVNAKVMSSQLDIKYTQRKGWLKGALAKLLAWDIKIRIRAGMIWFFPEKIFLRKFWRIWRVRKNRKRGSEPSSP